jgi:hypothetical protein
MDWTGSQVPKVDRSKGAEQQDMNKRAEMGDIYLERNELQRQHNK